MVRFSLSLSLSLSLWTKKRRLQREHTRLEQQQRVSRELVEEKRQQFYNSGNKTAKVMMMRL